VLQTKERIQTPSPFDVFTIRLVVDSIEEFGGASIKKKSKSSLRKHFKE
jgi:hypothetical protein